MTNSYNFRFKSFLCFMFDIRVFGKSKTYRSIIMLGAFPCKGRPRNDLCCVSWDIKPYSLTLNPSQAGQYSVYLPQRDERLS